MKIDKNTIVMILGFFGLTSYNAWKDWHSSYIEKQVEKQKKDKLVKEIIEGDLLNEQRKFNKILLKKIDSLKMYDLDQDSHIYQLEEFNAHWGYRY